MVVFLRGFLIHSRREVQYSLKCLQISVAGSSMVDHLLPALSVEHTLSEYLLTLRRL